MKSIVDIPVTHPELKMLEIHWVFNVLKFHALDKANCYSSGCTKFRVLLEIMLVMNSSDLRAIQGKEVEFHKNQEKEGVLEKFNIAK